MRKQSTNGLKMLRSITRVTKEAKAHAARRFFRPLLITRFGYLCSDEAKVPTVNQRGDPLPYSTG